MLQAVSTQGAVAVNIGILGCGPAGLLAAHAATIAVGPNRADEHKINVISKKRKSQMYGAQYLHAPIPMITESHPEAHIVMSLNGTSEGYRDKVYGQNWRGPVSPDELLGDHPAWNLRIAYDKLWARYGKFVVNYDLHPGVIEKLLARFDLVISTIPAHLLCKPEDGRNHDFVGQEIWAAGDAPEEGVFVPFEAKDNTIICNGEVEPAWYRLASIFGQTTVEWPGWMAKPPVESATTVTKPVSHNCTCFPDIVRLGRYGAWKKGVLVHHVFEDALRVVLERVTAAA